MKTENKVKLDRIRAELNIPKATLIWLLSETMPINTRLASRLENIIIRIEDLQNSFKLQTGDSK